MNDQRAAPISGEDHFLECLRSFHGLELTHDDLGLLHADLNQRRQQSQKAEWNARNSADPWIAADEITSGKVGQIILATGMGFATGGWVGAGLALLGGVIGAIQDGKNKKDSKNQRITEQYGFDQGGQVSPSGGLLPRIYGNRRINPAGGVRVSGMLIHSRVETRRGTNYLYQLYAISAGESPTLSYGQLGKIAPEFTLFNQQPRRNFNDREIKIMTRLGSRNQSAISEFPYYCQNITPPDYAVFGIDNRCKVGSSASAINPSTRQVNASFANGLVTKTAGGEAWNAGVFAENGLQSDGFLGFNSPTGTIAVGLSSTAQDQNYTSIQLGFLFQSGSLVIIESGIERTAPAPINPNSRYAIAFSLLSQQITYQVDGGVIYTSTISPALPLFPVVAMFSANAQVAGLNVSGAGLDLEGDLAGTLTPAPNHGSTATDQEIMDLFTPSQDYVVAITGELKRDPNFYVVDKDAYDDRTANKYVRRITTNPPVSGYRDKAIYAYWFARYENTKRVDRCDFNLVFSLSARHDNPKKQNDSNNGKLVTHGSLFDVWIRPVSDPIGSEVRLIRLVVKNRLSNKVYRAFRVMNLKLGRYYYEIHPLSSVPDSQNISIYELTDAGYGIADDTDREDLPTVNTGVVILGNEIKVQGELQQVSDNDVAKWITYDKKAQISSESGPTGRINSVNEIVHSASIDREIERYPGLALCGYRFIASERLQQAPALSTLVEEGSVIPNLLSAGVSSSLSGTSLLNSPGSNFIVDGVRIGHILRNLDQRIESKIIAVTASTIETESPLSWGNSGRRDRFLVFSLGSSCYFPDVFADAVRNDFSGIPELLDPDEYLDYPSLVRSRKFCVKNGYFFDDLLDQKTPFTQWASEQARYSNLYPTRIDGRFGLTPDTQTPIDSVFNAGNSRNFKLTYPDWQANITNTIVIRFIDGREVFDQSGARHKAVTVTIQTNEAYQGLVPTVIEEINARSVKTPEQAINIGCLYLKTLRQDAVGISFDTSYAAAYVQAGDIISAQHSIVDANEDYSGFVEEVRGDRVRLNCQPVLCEGISDTDKSDGVLLPPSLGSSSVSIGDLLVNLDTKQHGIIQSVSESEIIAPVEFSQGDEWLVKNLTMPLDHEAIVTLREDDSTHLLPASFVLSEGDAWLKIAAPLKRLDYVNIIQPTQQWRVQSVSPNGKELFSISANLHDPDIYSRSGLVIQVDDRVLRV